VIAPILLALVSTAEATSRIVVTSDVPVLVSVNGHPYTPKSTSYAILCDAGRNKVQAGNSLVIIDVPDGHEARMVVKTGKLTLTETVFVEGLKELDYVDYYYDPNEDPARLPTDVVRVEERPVTQDAPVAGPGTVRFVAEDGGFYNIKSDAAMLAELRLFQDARKDVQLKPGKVNIEVWDGGFTTLYAKGQLDVATGATVTLKVSESGVRADGGAFTPAASGG
jgi:hypothetical protein